MNNLKSILEKKKSEVKEVVGDRKWYKRVAAERRERPSSAKKPRTDPPQDTGQSQPAPAPSASNSGVESLPEAEVKRRLRRLGQPITLFGEDVEVRAARLAHAEATLLLRDEDAGGGDRANVLLDIRREDRERAKRSRNGECTSSCGGQPQAGPAKPTSTQQSSDGKNGTYVANEEESETMRLFREAAERLAAKRELDKVSIDERIIRTLQTYMREWKEDLDQRPPEAANTTIGLQAINGYRQTERAFAVLFERLAAHEVHQEIRSCLVMIIEAIEQRNYQHANEIYLQLSIGNQAWPIGVTSIGIHDRTAREKLSYYSNVKSQAHIMNDEATRKYLHGLSRLIKAVQGLRPTDPSRSVNFNAIEHAGLGAKVGMQKQNLLQLKAVGETWQAQGLAPAPHMLGPDGKVSVPSKWGNMLRSKAAAETTQTQKTDSV